MGGLLKKILYTFFGIAALLVIAAILISFLFDPNDYRDRIAEEVRQETGRELAIEGDLELTFFPWLAVNIGRTTLGNAPGFGDEPFLSFEEARLSIAVMPLIRGEGLKIGAVVLDSFRLNLAVAEDGGNNWQDMAEHTDSEFETAAEPEQAAEGRDVEFSIASVEISDAAVTYNDAQAGESYSLTNFDLLTGRVGGSDPVDIRSNFDFELQPAGVAGDFSIETSLLPGDDEGIRFGDTDISALGIDATVAFADDGQGAKVQVDAFSLKSLMTRLGIEPPVTADPDVLGKIIFAGNVDVQEAAITVTGVELVVDDSTFTGKLSVARNEAGTISIDLAGDAIDVDRYMEPATDAAPSSGDAVPVEIPVELIRALNVRGNLALDAAQLSGLEFENVELGLRAANGDMRLHPISADFFDGQYRGDVRINAAGAIPTVSVNENIVDVKLGALARAMFDQENVTGTINGQFKLAGQGEDLAAIQRSLGGSISMQLLDGAWEGTDVWHELRKARAMYKQEPTPEPVLPARTQFSSVKMTGAVSRGVFESDDLEAELPFMRLTGNGTVDFPTAEVDYRMTARILESPEFVDAASEEELEEFTEAVIPLRITGSLAAPSIAPDIEEMLKEEVREKVEEEIKDQLKKLLGGDG
jgi:AsmA protein